MELEEAAENVQTEETEATEERTASTDTAVTGDTGTASAELEQEAEVVAASEDEAAAVGFSVYLGPSVRGLLKQNQIYNAPKAQVLGSLETVIAQYPQVRHLIVAGNKLAESRVLVKTAGSLLYVQNQKMCKQLGGKTI